MKMCVRSDRFLDPKNSDCFFTGVELVELVERLELPLALVWLALALAPSARAVETGAYWYFSRNCRKFTRIQIPDNSRDSVYLKKKCQVSSFRQKNKKVMKMRFH